MKILRQRIFGLTDDGGGTSSMDFYKSKKAEWTSLGGETKLGNFKSWINGQTASGNGIANQASNMSVDKSTYKASTIKALPSSNTGAVGKSGGGGFALTDPNKPKLSGMASGIKANQQAASNPNNKSNLANSAYNSGKISGFKQGQQSVGLKQGAINTWNNMGTVGKVATGAALVGGAALLMRNRQKRKEAEQQLAAERAKNKARY